MYGSGTHELPQDLRQTMHTMLFINHPEDNVMTSFGAPIVCTCPRWNFTDFFASIRAMLIRGASGLFNPLANTFSYSQLYSV
jgi:hypothetical protein